MTQLYARLLRASLFAIVVAAGFATIKLVAEDVCGNPLACFEPGQEGEIWQALEPFGVTNDQAACTNSLHPDSARIRELSRQCQYNDPNEVPYPVLMPPKLGQLMDPFMLAVDGERIYVSDQSNHRIQAFLFDGTPIPFKHPIGDGVAGEGPYGPYPADARLTGHDDPITGIRLYSPDGIAVDADHKLVVGDFSGFINVFNPDGSPAFGTMANPQRFQLPRNYCEPDTEEDPDDLPQCLPVKASGIALSAGTVVRGFQVPVPPGDNGRIVVTDRLSSAVFIFDSGFNLVKQLPETVPADAEANSVCVYSETAPLGTFCTPAMAAIDNAGHVYISEYDNNRIQVLDLEGNPISYFGSSDLQYPWGITLDHHGRLVVADTEAQRIAFFKIEYPNGPAAPPVSTFQFELDAAGTLNGYPTAVVEQVGTAEGLDPAGRILVTDTLNNRVQRFQLPDLAIINTEIDLDAGTGSFHVAVPSAKATTVNHVGVSVQGLNANVTSLHGVSPANATPLDPLASAADNATPALGTTIAPGQIARYEFAFTPSGGGTVSFVFDAVGNGGATAADPESASVAGRCTTCVSSHAFFQHAAPAVPATAPSGWFNTALVARITATTSHAMGLDKIAFQFVSGPEASALRWGGAVHTVDAGGAASASADVPILSEGTSSFRYWAIGRDGTVETAHLVTVSLDLTAPFVTYTLAPLPNAAGWNKTAVSGTYRHSDGLSGPLFSGVGTFGFVAEGRGHVFEQTATDKAGNTSLSIPSDYSGAGGRMVNIDMTPPQLTVPAPITIVATGAGFGVIPPGMFDAAAIDPPLNDLREGVTNLAGSGVASITNPGAYQFPMGTSAWTFTATDVAGNSISRDVNVTVNKRASTISYTGATQVEYGQPLSVSATVGPVFATGNVVFTLQGNDGVIASLSGGHAATQTNQVLNAVVPGTYTLTVSYPGDASVDASSTTANIKVLPAPITVTADPKSSAYGTVLPLTYKITSGGQFNALGERVLFGVDAFSGALQLTGTSVGSHPIVQGTLSAGGNYLLSYAGANYTFTARPVTVTAASGTKTFGQGDPPLTPTHNGFLAGDNIVITASRVAGENVGSYQTSALASGAALPNYQVSYVTGNLVITPYLVTVTPRPKTMVVGGTVPTFDYDYGTFPAGYSASSVVTPPTCGVAVPPSSVGTYPITCSGGAIDNNVAFSYGTALLTVLSDNQRPVCTAATGGEIWPPNHKKFFAAPINGVVDPEGGPLTIVVTGIWQDELIDSTGDGKFSPDGEGVGTSTAWVRAERNGHGNKAKGNGRVYEILFTATDNKGASCSGSVLWTVPHDKGQRATAIDDGVRYDSTGVIPGARNKSQIHQKSPRP